MQEANRPLVILTCEHSVNHCPREVERILGIERDILKTHRGYDIGMANAVENLKKVLIKNRIEAVTFHSTVTRLVLDFNRSIKVPKTLKALDKLPLSLQKKFKGEYFSYRESVEKVIKKGLAAKRNVLVLSMHSFTPVFYGSIRRTDIGLLFDYRQPTERAVAIKMRKSMKMFLQNTSEDDLNIDLNLPYRGYTDSFMVDLNNKFRKNKYYSSLFIEYNQKHLKIFSNLNRAVAHSVESL